MIHLPNLCDYVENVVLTTSTIIYIGVGSYFFCPSNPSEKYERDIKDNHQFPPFIQDAKHKYFDKEILLIL